MTLDDAALLNRWEPVARALGVAPGPWREQYGTQLRLLPQEWLERMAAVAVDGDDLGGSYKRFTQVLRDAYANAVSNPSHHAKIKVKLGSTTNDQVFIPIAPCRIVDTRNVGGPIAAGTARNFFFYMRFAGTYSWAQQGGTPGPAIRSCPGTVVGIGGLLGNQGPRAMLATVTVVDATAAGNWVVWGGGSNVPMTSALNWQEGDVVANTTSINAGDRVGTGPGGPVLDFAVLYNGPSGQANVVVDVVGYFEQNRATALDCITTYTGAGISEGGHVVLDAPACWAGYSDTGVFCATGSNGFVYLTDVRQSGCVFKSVGGGSSVIVAERRCCRVPGQ